MTRQRGVVIGLVLTLVSWAGASAQLHATAPPPPDASLIEKVVGGLLGGTAPPPASTPPSTEPATTTTTSVPAPPEPTAPPTSKAPTTVPTTAAPTTTQPTTEPPSTTEPPPADIDVSVGPVEPPDAPPVRLSEPNDTAAPSTEPVAPEEPPAEDTVPPETAPPEPTPPVNPVWLQTGSRRSFSGAGGASAPIPGRAPAGERLAPVDEIDVILATIRELESGGRYDIGPNRASASGAYQYISSTWNGYADYDEAYLAPPAVQDERARADVLEILTRYAGNVAMVPVIWYYPRAVTDPTWMDRVPNPAGGNRLTVREYQSRWIDTYRVNHAAYAEFFEPSTDPGRVSVVTVDQSTLTAVLDTQVDVLAPPVLPVAGPDDPAATLDEAARAVERAAQAPLVLATQALVGQTLPTPATTIPATTIPPTTIPPTTIPPGDSALDEGQAVDGPVDTPPPTSEAPNDLPVEPPPTTVPPFTPNDGSMTDAALSWAQRSAIPTDVAPSGLSRPVVFPVLGPVTFADGWGDCRDDCRRRHVGTDIIGVQMQPLLAAVDGTVTRVWLDPIGISGAAISITDADGWRYNYFHVNNDTPGTDDGAALDSWRAAPGLTVGAEVVAGQIIGYMGNSGNAEASTTHLHFEIRDPSGVAHPSYAALRAAAARQACTIGLGPWSTPKLAEGAHLRSESVDALRLAKGPDGQLLDLDTGLPVEPELAEAAVSHTVVTPMYGTGEWTIDTDGRVTATGDAALIMPARDLACAPGPLEPFGTDAAGWQTALDTSTLAGTTIENVDLSGTLLDGLVPLATIPADDPAAPPPVDDVPLDGDPPPAPPASRVHAFRMPSSGEVVLLVFPAEPAL